MKRRLKLIAACGLLSVFAFQARALKITDDGKALAIIRLNGNAPAPVKLAAEEIRDYVKKISGAELVIAEKGETPLEIRLGCLENGKNHIPKEMVETLENADKDEAFYVKSDGDVIYVIGKTPVATLYGAYELLEKMGVRWFFPGPLGEHVPQAPTIELEGIDSFQVPAMNRSGFNLVCASFNFEKELEWLARNKFSITKGQGFRVYPDRSSERGERFFEARAIRERPRGGHCWLEAAAPGQELFDVHPEYFVLKDGKRRWTRKGRLQRCFSNPELKKLCENYVLKTTLEGREFHFAAEDAVGNYCHCPKCREMGAYDGKFTTTNLYHRFFSDIASRVIAQNPEAQLMAAAYTEFRDPPTAPDVHYDPNHVTIDICTHQRCYVHTFDDPTCKANVKQHALYLGWKKICPRIKFYDYINCAHSVYAPWEYLMVKDFRQFAKDGCAGWVDECPPPFAEYTDKLKKMYPLAPKKWFARWQLNYVLGKLSWNPDLNLEDVLDDAYDKYYGPAAAPMKEYHAFRRKLWEQAPGHAFYGGPTRTAFCLTVPGASEKLDGLLGEAESLAKGDDKILKRIALDKYYLDEFWKKEAAERKKLFSGEKRIVPRKNTGGMIIDGDLAEEVWLKARPITQFQLLSSKRKPTEDTNVRLAYDQDNLYVGVVASMKNAWSDPKANVTERDGDLWTDDSIEILLAPPGDNDALYYHIICNTKGVIYDAKCEAGVFDKSFDSKCDVAVEKTGDDYVYEFKIPLAPMGVEMKPGQVWGAHFVRGCANLQPPQTNETVTVDGVSPHSVMNFRKAVFGDNLVKNGNFEQTIPVRSDETGQDAGDVSPKFWACEGVEFKPGGVSGNGFVRIKNGRVYQLLAGGELKQSERVRDIIIGFNCSGSGILHVDVYRYSDKPSDDEPGYKREFRKTRTLKSFDLAPTVKRAEVTYSIDPNEWIGLAFRVDGEADLDDVTVLSAN